jgi:hypothetical protein
MGTDVFLLTKPAGSNSIQRACSQATQLPKSWPSTQSSLRHFGPIFTFKTAITQRLFEESKKCLKVLYAVFCTFSNDARNFYCNWIQNFPFFCCKTQVFLVVMYLYICLSNKPQT